MQRNSGEQRPVQHAAPHGDDNRVGTVAGLQKSMTTLPPPSRARPARRPWRRGSAGWPAGAPGLALRSTAASKPSNIANVPTLQACGSAAATRISRRATTGAYRCRQGGLFTVDMTLGGISNICVPSDTASLSSFVLPYFSDANLTVSAPVGWSYHIDPSDASLFGITLGSAVSTRRFTANAPSGFVAAGTRLSGSSFTSAFAAVSSPYQTNYLRDGDTLTMTQVAVPPFADPSAFAFIAGSAEAPAALGDPMPADLPTAAVPEPSTWAMLTLGLAVIVNASRLTRPARKPDAVAHVASLW